MPIETAIATVVGCYALSIVIVLFSGGVPSKWRTWPVVHMTALAIPIAVLTQSVLIAIPGLIVLGIIIGATSGFKRR